MKDTKKLLGVDELKSLIEATYKIIDSSKSSKDPHSISTELYFMHLFIETLLNRHLKLGVKKIQNRQANANDLMKSFALVKQGVCLSVSSAFQKSMENFSGMSIDYYCIISTAQDSKSNFHH